jgi:hypothetical protein
MKSRFAEIRAADLPERSEDFIVLCTISLRTSGLHFYTMTIKSKGGTYVLPFHVGNGFATELEGIGIGVLNKNSSRFCIGSTNGIAPH